MTPLARFWLKVKKSPDENGCWLWIGARCAGPRGRKDGYGQFRVIGGTVRAHRFAYENLVGPIPREMVLLHSCDNTGCVNPRHLSVGTKLDNFNDMMTKGRGRFPGHVLSPETQAELRERLRNGESVHLLAQEYGVTRKTLHRRKSEMAVSK